jgi:vacuolar protein sorting-associated protein 8
MLIEPAVECGAITSIAISADHSTIAGGHANGTIFTWDTARAARPFLHIPHLDPSQVQNRSADGHVPNAAVCHLGFLGTRHTALVSANVHGMAFSHLATRGTGAIGRSVKTARILGRYPNDVTTTGKPRKPSTVLAFAPLPLGNAERGTDDLGLTAMLTPYLLVVVSTTPIAQTQHKAARPKEVTAHGAMSGCLAWFPAVKLKVKDPRTGDTISKVKLVYCWSNVLTVMDIEEVEASDKDKPPNLFFKPRSRWKADEAIVAVQWLSRSVLCALTITQRLIILEDPSMRMTEAFDLIQKHIFHQDLFSKQLHNLVEQLDEDDTSMHGVVADAFYMSFKAYKGKMFLLGFNDVSVGALSNWADRLIALMEDSDYIGAIHLATSYYTGDADKLTVGLPEDTGLRHAMVQDKLTEIMSASLKFAFSKSNKTSEREVETSQLKDLAEACFVACLNIGNIGFLFDEAYEWYEESNSGGIFLESLEPYILDRQISSVPPAIVKSLVTYYVSKGWESRLEEIVCHMDTATMDIDQITMLCKQHDLYDALIYVWSQALHDYITPMIDLLALLIPLVQNGDSFTNGNVMDDAMYEVNALKMFPYLSYTLTGRVYPTGESLEDEETSIAKAGLYWFLFSGKTVTWPKGSSKRFLTRPNGSEEPSFPYLRMILKFDASSFLSALNEAFEDPFLNDTPDRAVNGGRNHSMPEEQVFGLSVNRQYIVSILLEVMNPTELATKDTIYLDMFIARNLPKFPQYLVLSGSSLDKVLAGLSNYPGEDIADDAQLSAEYLLSVYHPADLSSLIPLFHKARFYRVLKSIYKSDKQYAKLMQAYFDDYEDREAVFNCIADCLRPRTGLTKRQIVEVHDVIRAHAAELVRLDPTKAAQTIEAYAPSLHKAILEALAADPEHEYAYLQTILEPPRHVGEEAKESPDRSLVERYVQLMCKFRPEHVVDFVSLAESTDLRLDKVLPAMEESEVVDAAVILMARDGLVKDAMERLTKHLGTLGSAFLAILELNAEDTDHSQREKAAEDLLEALQKYTNVGIWLCQGQTKITIHRLAGILKQKRTSSKTELLPDEILWLDFIDATVQITKSISASITRFENADSTQSDAPAKKLDTKKLLSTLRTLVQRTFTALLSLTSTPSAAGTNLAFLRVLRAFLTRASISSPNLSDLRSVLSSIFSAYAYEENILSLANRLLEKDLFVNVQLATELRQRGWRPKGSVCEGCRRRVWGPGATGDIFKKWEEKQVKEAVTRKERSGGVHRAKAQVDPKDEVTGGDASKGKGKDKEGMESPAPISEQNNPVKTESQDKDLGPLIVLACRHIYHQSCLEAMQAEDSPGDQVQEGREFKCPIDG